MAKKAVKQSTTLPVIGSGIPGLDEVLGGGFLQGRASLVRGGPGTGKTMLGRHFVAEGVANDEPALFITLGEKAEQIRTDSKALGLDLARVAFLDLSPDSAFFTKVESYDIFTPAEVEREPVTQSIIDEVKRLKPKRVFIDAMTQFRYLAPDVFQYRKQVLSLLRYLAEQGATVLFSSESSAEAPDEDLQFLADGVIHLAREAADHSLRVSKLRGAAFLPGSHAMRIGQGGVQIFPQLRPALHRRTFSPEPMPTGVPELDELLHGGVERGTVTIISGPSGVGKSTLGSLFIKETAGRGEYSVLYTFEEPRDTLLHRCQSINIDVTNMIKRRLLAIESVEPLQYTQQEFALAVREQVERHDARLVMIDSVAGFGLSVRGRNGDVLSKLHALCKYLTNMGVTVILINEVQDITGDFRVTDTHISYLADNIIFLRYLEIEGTMQKAIGVLKKRLSDFERTLRQFDITHYGIKVGEPLSGLRGILQGTPEWVKGKGDDG